MEAVDVKILVRVNVQRDDLPIGDGGDTLGGPAPVCHGPVMRVVLVVRNEDGMVVVIFGMVVPMVIMISACGTSRHAYFFIFLLGCIFFLTL